jgi:CRISPR-associated protein Csd1
MILQALYKLAQEEGLAEDLDFQRKEIPCRLVLQKEGKDSSVHCLLGANPETNRLEAPSLLVPFQEKRSGSKAPAYFLVDKMSFLFGVDPSGDDPERAERELSRYHARVQDAADVAPSGSIDQEALRALLAFLELPHEARVRPLHDLLKSLSKAESTKATQGQFIVVYTPGGPDPIHLYPWIQTYWRSLRQPSASPGQSTCLVTGRHCSPIEKHPAVKLVPGGNAGDASLISFNKVAFESYGLSGNANAPVGREAAETCATALNRLLAPSPIHPDGHRLPRRNLRLSDDTAALFWNAGGGADLDWLMELSGEDPDSIRLALESPKTGRPAPLEDPSRFFTLLISGAQGRSIIRNFIGSSTRDVAAAIQQFLGDVSIEKPFGKGTGAYPLWLLLRSLAVLGKAENLPPSLASEVYLAAIQDRPLPPLVLSAAVRRNRAEAGRMGDQDAKKRGDAIQAFAARCSLIRAFLIRQSHPSRKEILVSLDPNCREIGYVLGRLLAVLDKTQSLAIPGANATVVDRFYGTASTAPATVFPTLLQKGQQHFGKLRGDKEKPWAFPLVDKALCEVTERIEAKPFPKVLDLPSQGLFALGFHHQRQAFFTKKDSPASSTD